MIHTMQLFKAGGRSGRSLRQTTVTAGKLMATAVGGLLILAACASAPLPPKAELQAAEMAIANAERDRVADYASVELSEARDKLRAAHSAVQQEKMVLAQRLAEQSRVDAELASARAEAARAEVVNQEMRDSIGTLKQEIERNSGDTQ
jgi:hypothetical protein